MTFLLGACSARAATSIVINEYTNSSSGVPSGYKFSSGEYIEFVLTSDMTVADFGNLTFGDSNSATTNLNSSFKFNTTTLQTALGSNSNFLAGTIIVVKGSGLGPENLSYNPLATNITDDDAWGIELSVSLISGPNNGVLNNPISGVVSGNYDISNLGDVVWIANGNPTSSTDTSGFLYAIGHKNSSPGVIANAADAIDPFTIGSPTAVYNTAGALVSLTNSGILTMGTGNTTSNTQWIYAMRGAASVPEPSRMLLLFCGVLGLLLRRQRR